MSTLVERLIPIKNRMNSLAARLGIPQYLETVLQLPDSTQVLLQPRPLVKSMTSRDIQEFLANQVDIAQEYLWLSQIPRTYDTTTLGRSLFLLNATQAPNGTWVGTKAKVDFIDRNELLTYKVLVSIQRSR